MVMVTVHVNRPLPGEECLRAGGALVRPDPLSPVDLLVASRLKESQKCLKTNVKLDLYFTVNH